MVDRRAVCAIAVSLACILAGCAGNKRGQGTDTDGDGVPDADDPTPDGGTLPDGLTYTPGYVGPDGGYIEGDQVSFFCQSFANSTVAIDQNRTLTGNSHSHDMWSGDDSKVIFEGLVDKFAGGNWFATPGAVVFPGAGRAEFRLDWEPLFDGDWRQLGVNVPLLQRTSGDVYVDYLLNFTEAGQVHAIEFNFTANDRPHAEQTSWAFKMNPHNPATEAIPPAQRTLANIGVGAASSALGLQEATLTWTIYRTYDCLPVDPPHYDLWNGTTSKLVMETTSGPHDYTNSGAASSGRWYGFQNGGGGIPDNGTVPPGSATLIVEMTWHSSDVDTLPLGLEYVGADRRASSTTTVWNRPPLEGQEGTTRTYRIAVHPLETDSPYAERSAWDFRWYIDGPGDEVQEGPGPGHFKGTVDWKVTAYRDGFAPA